jgi:hypothetical protein
VKIPTDFIETNPPKFESDDWYTLNHSQNEFGVKIIDNKLEIKKVKTVNRCELKILEGTLIGIDNGEFGGQLSFQPNKTTEKTVKINRGNIKFIFNYKDKIYFIGGYSHQVTSTGALYELERINNIFTFKLLVDFEDAPFAFTIYEDKFLVATNENFYIVKDFKKELLFKKTFWRSLYPNSIAAFNDTDVLIGIRSGIVKLDLKQKTFKFYKNDK